jgi:hypothetical protein
MPLARRLVVAFLLSLAFHLPSSAHSSRAPTDHGIDVAVIVSVSDVNPTDIRKGLTDFVTTVQGAAAVSIRSLARPATMVPYTSDATALNAAVASIHGRGFNGSYVSMRDAMIEAARSLSTRTASRRAIVVISDQTFQPLHDRSSELAREVSRSGAALFYIAISESQPPYGYRDGTYYLKPLTNVDKTIPDRSGGRVIHLLAASGVPAALRDIAAMLNRQ